MKLGIDIIEEMNDCVAKKGEIYFWWLGQLGYAMKIGSKNVYVDAYLSPDPMRNYPPVISANEVTNADIIIGTHDHIDHIDRMSWKVMAEKSPQAVFVLPSLHKDSVAKECNISSNRLFGLNDGMKLFIEDITISGIAAAHEFLDRDEETGNYPYLSVLIEGNDNRIYHSGDCCIYPEIYTKMEPFRKPDIAFLPINGRDAEKLSQDIIGNMTFQEAVDFAGFLEPFLTVPGHYDMFAINQEDPQKFIDYISIKYPNLDYWVGERGMKVRVSLSKE